MKFLLILLFPILSFAEQYSAISLFRISPQESSSDEYVSNFSNIGHGQGITYGYLFDTFAPEIGLKHYKIKGQNKQLTIQNNYLNLGVRLFLGYFNFNLGFAINNSDGKNHINDQKYRSIDTTLSYGFGLRYQFEKYNNKWDIFTSLNIHSVEDTKIPQSKFIMREFELGLRLYFR